MHCSQAALGMGPAHKAKLRAAVRRLNKQPAATAPLVLPPIEGSSPSSRP